MQNTRQRREAQPDPQRLRAEDRGRPADLRGARRRRAAHLRAGQGAADGAALLPVLSERMLRDRSRTRPQAAPHGDTLTLPFELRQKSRLRARLDSGAEVGAVPAARARAARRRPAARQTTGRWCWCRRPGRGVDGERGETPRLLARAAYHLGNRHVALQVGAGWVRYQHDHVLDDMVRALGADGECGAGRVRAGGRGLRAGMGTGMGTSTSTGTGTGTSTGTSTSTSISTGLGG